MLLIISWYWHIIRDGDAWHRLDSARHPCQGNPDTGRDRAKLGVSTPPLLLLPKLAHSRPGCQERERCFNYPIQLFLLSLFTFDSDVVRLAFTRWWFLMSFCFHWLCNFYVGTEISSHLLSFSLFSRTFHHTSESLPVITLPLVLFIVGQSVVFFRILQLAFRVIASLIISFIINDFHGIWLFFRLPHHSDALKIIIITVAGVVRTFRHSGTQLSSFVRSINRKDYHGSQKQQHSKFDTSILVFSKLN